ncbi:MAG: sulfotransferase domain-containing protein [Alphaproteobacteria bacterium]
MIATIPHSGTWMLRYFVVALNLLYKGEEATLEKVYAATRASEWDFTEGLGIPAVAVDHNPLPGFATFWASYYRWDELAKQLGSFEYFLERDKLYGKYSPIEPPLENESKMVFIYRNPLDLFVALGRHAADRVQKHGYQGDDAFHPLMPTRGRHRPGPPEQVFHDFINDYESNRFFEAYLVHFLSYHICRDRIPNHLMFLPYSEIRKNRLDSLIKMSDFLLSARDASHIKSASDFCTLEAMLAYEKTLGHSFAGPTTFDGKPETSHVTSFRQVRWEDCLTIKCVNYAKSLFERHNINFDMLVNEQVPSRLAV